MKGTSTVKESIHNVLALLTMPCFFINTLKIFVVGKKVQNNCVFFLCQKIHAWKAPTFLRNSDIGQPTSQHFNNGTS